MDRQYADLFMNFYRSAMQHHTYSQLYKSSLSAFLLHHPNNSSPTHPTTLPQHHPTHPTPHFQSIQHHLSTHHLYEIVYFYLFFKLVAENKFKEIYNVLDRMKVNLRRVGSGVQVEIKQIIFNKINRFCQSLQHLQFKLAKQCKIQWIYLTVFKEFQSSFYSFTEVLCIKDSALEPMAAIKKQNYQSFLKILNVKCLIAEISPRKKLVLGDGLYQIYIGYRQQKYFVITEKQYSALLSDKSEKGGKTSSKGSKQESSQKIKSAESQKAYEKEESKQYFLGEMAKMREIFLRNSEVIGGMAGFKDLLSKHDLLDRA